MRDHGQVDEVTAVTPDVAAAAAWWSSRLAEVTLAEGAAKPRGHDLVERERYRVALEQVLAGHLRECAGCGSAIGRHTVFTDWGPCDLLCDAAKRAGIMLDWFDLPVQSMLLFRDEAVIARQGDGRPYETVWEPSA